MPKPSMEDVLTAVATATWIYCNIIVIGWPEQPEPRLLYQTLRAIRTDNVESLSGAHRKAFVAALEAAVGDAMAHDEPPPWLDADACRRVIAWALRQEVAA